MRIFLKKLHPNLFVPHQKLASWRFQLNLKKNMLVQMDPSSPNFGMKRLKKRKPPSSISWIKQMVQTLLVDDKTLLDDKPPFGCFPPPAPSAARTSHTGFPSDSSDPASAPPPWHRPWPRPRRGVRRARRRPGVGDWRPGWRSRCPYKGPVDPRHWEDFMRSQWKKIDLKNHLGSLTNPGLVTSKVSTSGFLTGGGWTPLVWEKLLLHQPTKKEHMLAGLQVSFENLFPSTWIWSTCSVLQVVYMLPPVVTS